MQSINVQVNDEFLTDANAQMIWDIMQESRVYNNVEYQDKIEIRKNFIQNMRSFYEQRGRSIPHLMEQNKLFIGAILNEYMAKDKPNSFVKSQTKEVYTTKDIQAARASQFERDLDKHRNDFENSIAAPKPPVPVFSDKMDKPISEMNALIAKTMVEREFEIAQIHQGLSRSPNPLQTPMETSVRMEKQVFKQINISNESPPQKYIIQATELSPPPPPTSSNTSFDKKVTVDESQNRIHLFVEEIDLEEENGFMSKFKVSNNPAPIDEKGEERDTNVYQELRQQQRKQQQQHQELGLKIDELSKKMDLIIDFIRERSS
jgi:hypothetical protein